MKIKESKNTLSIRNKQYIITYDKKTQLLSYRDSSTMFGFYIYKWVRLKQDGKRLRFIRNIFFALDELEVPEVLSYDYTIANSILKDFNKIVEYLHIQKPAK